MDFFTRFTHEKTPQNNFSSQNFSVENNYFLMQMRSGFRNSKRKLYQRDLLIFADIFVYSTGQNQDFFSYFFTECATAI